MSEEEILEEMGVDFSTDESAEESMKQYIIENFSDTLGDKIELLEAENGLELVLQEVQRLKSEAGLESDESVKVA